MAGNLSTPAPAIAAAVGYTTQSFGGDGITLGGNIFAGDDPSTSHQDGANIIVTHSVNNSFNDQLQTALPDGTGTTFGDGGYFVATMSFTGTPSTDRGWPSFWGGTYPWEGDKVETDIVEWWGVGNAASNAIFWPGDDAGAVFEHTINQPMAADFDPSQPHRYSMLWTTESLSFYIDEVIGQVVRLDSPYDILNAQNIVLTLGTGHNNPLTIYSLNVWQAAGAVNLVNGVEVAVSGSQPDPTPPTPIVTGSGPDTLVLNISEDAYQGDAQFTVSVDGKQLGGTFTTAALHASGASQGFTFKGDWAVGAHAVAVNFLNDAWGGTAATDRNLYVDGISYNGKATGQNATLLGTGPKSFTVTDAEAVPITVTGNGSDTLVLNISEDAYQGDAQFTVSVDGKQLGGTFTATAMHASGASQGFTFKGNFGSGQHAVAVNFLNDAWGGTAATDRNLYVNSISYNGTATGQSATLLGTGPATFTVSGDTTPSVSGTGDHGSLQKNLSQTGTYTVGGDTFVLSSGNAASVTLGAGVSQIKFIGASSVTLTGGAGQANVTADVGSNTFVAGTGSLDVTGGSGSNAYAFHADSGLLTIEDFSLAKGDTLTVDEALKDAFTQVSDGHGGMMLTFGTDAGHGVDILGMTAAIPGENVLWV